MNFNIILFFTLFSLVACGVKGDPVAPKQSKVPSLIENYPDIKTDKPLRETKKK